MAPRITIIGGGSTHWTPSMLIDFANTESLRDAELVLMDIAEQALPPMVALAQHVAEVRDLKLQVSATTDLRKALDGADFVVTAFSVGGFDSMRHDIEIPAAYGVRQPVGDSVGPGGIFRALRSVPVIVEVARAVEDVCPEALLVNVTNPLTALCRAASSQTGAKVVGLCNELVGLTFYLSLLFDVGIHEIDPVVGGVNHLPLVTALRVGGDEEGFARLRDLLHDPVRADDPIWLQQLPPAMHWRKVSPGEKWTKADVIANNRLKFELFERFGVLPGSADTHVAEFFGGFVTEHSDFGREWCVHHYGMAGHRADKDADDEHAALLMAAQEISGLPSGELIANLLDGVVTGNDRALPVNLPNQGQVGNLGEGLVVECIGISGAGGVRPRDQVTVPGLLGEHLRRVAASQEMTVAAALSGDRTAVLEAMLSDPMTARLPYEQVLAMTDELFAATAPWLRQFA